MLLKLQCFITKLANLYVDSSEEAQNRQIYSHSVYPVVKGGIISLTRYLAAYWGEKNIRVNFIINIFVNY